MKSISRSYFLPVQRGLRCEVQLEMRRQVTEPSTARELLFLIQQKLVLLLVSDELRRLGTSGKIKNEKRNRGTWLISHSFNCIQAIVKCLPEFGRPLLFSFLEASC